MVNITEIITIILLILILFIYIQYILKQYKTNKKTDGLKSPSASAVSG